MGSNPSGTRALAPRWDDHYALLMVSPDTVDEFLIFRWDQIDDQPGYRQHVWFLSMFAYLYDRHYAVQNYMLPQMLRAPLPDDQALDS